jgi:hypothetical protein
MTQFTCKGVKQINNRISLNMTFTFTIRIFRCFSSAREFQMGNFQKYWSQNVGQDFIVLDFFHRRKVDGRDGRDPQNREKNAPAGRFTCTQSTKFVLQSCIIVRPGNGRSARRNVISTLKWYKNVTSFFQCCVFSVRESNSQLICNSVRVIVFNFAFNNISVISWRSALVVE